MEETTYNVGKKIKVCRLMVGEFCTNCYLLVDLEGKTCLAIDPGAEPRRIIDTASNEKIRITSIINTHGHIDHIGANAVLKETTSAKIYIHEADSAALVNAERNLSLFTGTEKKFPPADHQLKDGEKIKIGAEEITILHTPGHTPGSICLLGSNYIFTGDTLFADSIGRTDLPSGNENEIYQSLKKILKIVKGDPVVLPGHGEVGYWNVIKKTNPFLNVE